MSKTLLKESYSKKSKIESFFTSNKIQLSSDGNHIFSACDDVLKVLNVSDGRVIKEFKSEAEDIIITFGLSNDDQTVVIGYQSGLIRQWLWIEDRLERTWKSIHVGPIAQIVFDTTDTLVATGGTDSTVKVWNIRLHYCTHNLKGATGVFSCVVFAPKFSDQEYYLYGSADDYSIHVWNLVTSERIAKLDGHCSKVTAIRFTRNKEHILSASRDKLVIVWNASNHQMIRSIPVFESLESIEVINYKNTSIIDKSLNDKVFVTAGEKGILRLWNYETGQLLYTQKNSLLTFTENKQNTTESQLIIQTIYCEQSQQIVVVSFENNILFHNLEDFTVDKQLIGHIDEVLDIKIIGSDEQHMAVATNSPTIKIFEINTLNCYLLKGHTDIVLCLATFASNPNILLSSSKDNVIRVWYFNESFSDAQCFYYGSGHTHSVTAVATPSISSTFFVSGSEDTTLKIWKLPKTKPNSEESPISLSTTHTERAHEKAINSLAISPNDQLIASGSQDKIAKIWTVDGLKLTGILRGHRKGIWCVQFSNVDQIVATSSADATIKLWALSDFSCLKTFEGHDSSVLKVSFIDRGMQLISSSSDGNLKIWNIKSNECIKTIDAHNDKIWAMTLSKDESLLITGASDSAIYLWNDVTAEEREEKAVEKEGKVKSEQNLLNLMHKRNWSKALKLAIKLNHPFRALNIIKEIILESNKYQDINNVLLDLKDYQLLTLLDYAIVWNTNSKNYIAAQCVMKAVFETISPKEFTRISDFKQKVEKLLPYNERHVNRLTRLQQSVSFVDYVWQTIKMQEMTDSDEQRGEEPIGDQDSLEMDTSNDKQYVIPTHKASEKI